MYVFWGVAPDYKAIKSIEKLDINNQNDPSSQDHWLLIEIAKPYKTLNLKDATLVFPSYDQKSIMIVSDFT